MLCVACGTDVPAGSAFCPQCGRATSATEAAPAPPPPPPPPPPPSPAPPPGGGYGGAPTGYAPPPFVYGPPPGAYRAPPGPGGGSAGPVAEGLATFGQRVGAVVIDGFILWLAMAAGFLVVGATVPEPEPFVNPNPGPSGLGVLIMMITWLIGPAYYVIMEGRPDGQTLGKKAMGIRAVRKSNGAPLGYGLAIGRYVARFADWFTLGLGLLWAAWDPLHQTFHDKIVGTLVVRSAVYPAPGKVSGPGGYQAVPPNNPFQVN